MVLAVETVPALSCSENTSLPAPSLARKKCRSPPLRLLDASNKMRELPSSHRALAEYQKLSVPALPRLLGSMAVSMPLVPVPLGMSAAPQVPGLPLMAEPGGLDTLLPVGAAEPSLVALRPLPLPSATVAKLDPSSA